MADFCDFCGEVITNYHKSIEDDDNLYYKILAKRKKEMLKGYKGLKRLWIGFWDFPNMPKELDSTELIFCNKEHHKLFIKKYLKNTEEAR